MPVPVPSIVLRLPGVTAPSQLLHLLLEQPAHFRQAQRNQLPDQLHPRVQL